ncbi:MAG: MarR family winged helix-turn-helix transcriptional regulator [Thermoleophilaceae bacterium]
MGTTTSTRAQKRAAIAAFNESFEEFVNAIRRARGRAERDRSEGLSLSQFKLLEPLLTSEPRPVGELAAAASVSAPSATRMLDGLERDGALTREHSPDDRRVVAVRLTASGREAVEAKRDYVESKRRAVYESLSPNEREQAQRLLTRIAQVIDEL